jgi:hypothetical protein
MIERKVFWDWNDPATKTYNIGWVLEKNKTGPDGAIVFAGTTIVLCTKFGLGKC